MLDPKELRFSGIGRFVEEQVIDFTKLGNLVQVDGNYVDTGGSSGAGKTTVFNALDFLLGLNDVPNSVLQSRLTDKHINVQGTFDLDGKPLTITRGKKLAIDHDGVLTTGSSKLTEEKLDQILGMPRDLFRAILHKRQKEGGFFLKLTPSKMNDFLVSCLGLNEERKKLEKVDAKLDELQKQKNTTQSARDAAQSALLATQAALGSLGAVPACEVTEQDVQALKAKWEASRDVYRATEARHKKERDDLESKRPQITLVPYDRSKLEAYEKGLTLVRQRAQALVKTESDRQAAVNRQISDLRVEKFNLTNAVSLGESAKAMAVQVATEIKKIRESLCPTCEQGWTNEKAKERDAELLTKIKLLKETIQKGTQSADLLTDVSNKLLLLADQAKPVEPLGIKELAQKETEINYLIAAEKSADVAHTRLQNENNKVTLDLHSFQATQMRLRNEKELGHLYDAYSLDDKAHTNAYLKLKNHAESLARHEKTRTTLAEQEKFHSEKLLALTVLNKTLEDEIAILTVLNRAIKTFISCSFDDALEQIGDSATRIVRSIPTMANATVQLTGIRETKDGKVKEEVNAVIHMDGDEGIPIKSLCGGEGSSVDLAVDLAVIDLVENKANKGISIFILDEPFTGLDTVCIEMALDVLKNSNTNKKLIIVDHNPEVKQMVESRIMVVRKGLTSNLQSPGETDV